METRMTLELTALSPRNAIPYNEIPSGVTAEDYGAILDCVYEMADDVATANGIGVWTAIGRVLRYEKWILLECHERLIYNLLTEE